MKLAIVCALILAPCAFAQPEVRTFALPVAGPLGVTGEFGGTAGVVQGAPYSATIVNESTQSLADGNRIVQRSTGNTARDSMGRTRQDMALPAIANLSAANAPHIVFIQDPVAQTGYSLNLTDKTAHKLGIPGGTIATTGGPKFGLFVNGQAVAGAITSSVVGAPGPLVAGVQKTLVARDQGDAKTENLGSQTMEGVQVQGVRTTRTIPAGEIGNDKPIDIVTEVWTSLDLKTIVYSKRSDPRVGDQTFRLTNIVRSEPDSSLFTVPSDFKIVEGSEPGQDVIFYRRSQ